MVRAGSQSAELGFPAHQSPDSVPKLKLGTDRSNDYYISGKWHALKYLYFEVCQYLTACCIFYFKYAWRLCQRFLVPYLSGVVKSYCCCLPNLHMWFNCMQFMNKIWNVAPYYWHVWLADQSWLRLLPRPFTHKASVFNTCTRTRNTGTSNVWALTWASCVGNTRDSVTSWLLQYNFTICTTRTTLNYFLVTLFSKLQLPAGALHVQPMRKQTWN